MSIAVGLLLLIGSFFMLLASLGVVRFPDTLMRLQATTKASTLGAGALGLAVAIRFGEVDVSARVLLVIVFLALTAPVGAHVIGRAAHRSGIGLWSRYIRDDLRSRAD